MVPTEKIEYLQHYGPAGASLYYKRRYFIWVEPEYPEHSDGQRGYAHGVVFPLLAKELWGDDSAASCAEMKERLKSLFRTKPRGETIRELILNRPKDKDVDAYAKELWEMPENQFPWEVESTAGLSTIEYEIWLEQIRRWALSEHKIFIPLPKKMGY